MITNQILHICLDEKFNHMIVRRFDEADQVEHKFIIANNDKKDPKFENPDGRIQVLDIATSIDMLHEYRYVVIHCANDLHLEIASNLSSKNISALIYWGPGHVEFDLMGYQIFEPLSRKIVIDEHLESKQRHFMDAMPPWFRNLYYKLRTGKTHPQATYYKAYSKIDFLATILPEEYDELLKINPKIEADFLELTYGTMAEILDSNYQENRELGENILVGHSAFMCNNQIDALNHLIKKGYKNKVIVPTSYGADRGNSVYNYGKEKFAERFVSPGYLSKQAYIDMLYSCNSAIFNNIVQQGIGNLYTCLYLGMRVYLNNKGLLYRFCKEKDFNVFSFQEEFDSKAALVPLDNESKMHNRQILDDFMGNDQAKSRVRKFVDAMLNAKPRLN